MSDTCDQGYNHVEIDSLDRELMLACEKMRQEFERLRKENAELRLEVEKWKAEAALIANQATEFPLLDPRKDW